MTSLLIHGAIILAGVVATWFFLPSLFSWGGGYALFFTAWVVRRCVRNMTPQWKKWLFGTLDSNFKNVYNEVLTRALEISCDHNKENGDCFLIRSNGFVRKTDKDEWKKINGDWVYFIPSSAK